MQELTKDIITAHFKTRKASSHKGSHGHALIIAGRMGRMGAAVIAARACLRSGTGLLTVNVPTGERFILQTAIPEAMLTMRENEQHDLNIFSAAGVGPGMGTDIDSKKILTLILNDFKQPLLLDADALNMIATDKELLNKLPVGTILTPHPKEFDKLFGSHNTIEERISTAIQKAKEYNSIIVLKGHQTIVTGAGESYINNTGNAGLAKGGSGDALTGIITAFLAQGYPPLTAAIQGVYIHGLAADLALEKQSMESMLITDVIECIGVAFKQI